MKHTGATGERMRHRWRQVARRRGLWLAGYTLVASALVMGMVSLSGEVAPTLGETGGFAIQGFVLVALALAAGLLADDIVDWVRRRCLTPETAIDRGGSEYDCRCEREPTPRR